MSKVNRSRMCDMLVRACLMPDMKWFGIVTIVVFLCEIHGDDYFLMCVFLCVTTLIWYLRDLYERYHLWKEPHPRL